LTLNDKGLNFISKLGSSMAVQNYLTQVGHKKLKEELDHLRNFARVEVAAKIKEARDMGNIEENLVYDAALEEQGYVEGRIAEIEDLLANSIVVEDVKSDTVVLGSVVIVEFSGRKDTFRIVGSAESDPIKRLISNESPVGKALLGAKIGDVVVVKTPVIVVEYKIVEIK
jgi:transcription elongation factor GreA